MKKTYTKPEIQVSKFDVVTVTNTSSVMNTGVFVGADGQYTKQAVAVVDYTTIFQTK